eukprot:13892249-Alexandrium_andersonii.AAC.1
MVFERSGAPACVRVARALCACAFCRRFAGAVLRARASLRAFLRCRPRLSPRCRLFAVHAP